MASEPYASDSACIDELLRVARLRVDVYASAVAPEGADLQHSGLKGHVTRREDLRGMTEDPFTPQEMSAYARKARVARDVWRHVLRRMKHSTEQDVFVSFEYVSRVFELTDFERHCFLLALSAELDAQISRAFVFLQDDVRARYATLELASRLYDLNPEKRMALQRDVVRRRSTFQMIFDMGDAGAKRLSMSSFPLRLHERVFEYLFDVSSQPEDARGAVVVRFPWDERPPLLHETGFAPAMADFILRRKGDAKPLALIISGARGAGKTLQVEHCCAALGATLVTVDLRRIQNLEMDAAAVEVVARECALRQAVPCLEHVEALLSEDEDEPYWLREMALRLGSERGVVFVTGEKEWKPGRLGDFDVVSQALAVPDAQMRLSLYRAMGAPQSVDLEAVAGKFVFSPGQIRGTIDDAAVIADWEKNEIGEEAFYKASLKQISHNLGQRATQVNARFAWDDLVLPPLAKGTLKAACDQVRFRRVVYDEWGFGEKLPYGRGLSMLFSGPPGTGKTMAAQVIANALRLELYKVDISAVVSKYIGETEKNLKNVFDEVKKSQSILFFDEADSLFGKRTEVKDSHDRYANIESSFLLQKIEEYDGIVILASNFLQNFDDAFRRRIKFIIDFPFPDASQREKLWRMMFAKHAPVDHEGMDFAFLSKRFELSGAAIKNIVIGAAFLAAAAGQDISMGHILLAARTELAKSGKIMLKEDLGAYAGLMQG